MDKKVKCTPIWWLILISKNWYTISVQLWDLVSRIQNEVFACCESKYDVYLETIQCVTVLIRLPSCALFTLSATKLPSCAMVSATLVSSSTTEEKEKRCAINSALKKEALLGSHCWYLLHPLKGDVRKKCSLRYHLWLRIKITTSNSWIVNQPSPKLTPPAWQMMWG